ncbi:hypothetical protein ABPG72_003780 [Tetrahymena utriculariae]
MELDPVTFTLNKIAISQELVSDVVSSIMQTIIYHRALGTVFINFQQCQKLTNTTYMYCGDEQVNESIKQLINQIEKDIQSKPDKNLIGQIKLTFKNQEKTKYLSFLDKKPAKVFEKWLISLEIKKNQETIHIQRVESDVQSIVFQIVDFANKNYDHIDESYISKSKDKIVVFPFEIEWVSQQSRN